MSAPSAKRKAIVILPEAAYPVMGGGPLRTACMLEFLRERFELHAVMFRIETEPDPIERYPPGMFRRHLTIPLPVHSKSLAARAFRNLERAVRGVSPLVDRFSGHEEAIRNFVADERYQLGWCEHFWSAPYVNVLGGAVEKTVLDLHNIESDYFATAEDRASQPQRWIWARFREVSAQLESELFPAFDFALAASEANARQASSARRSVVVPNAIPLSKWPAPPRTPTIAFSGNFAYAPNLEGMAWFAKNVWPRIFLRNATARLRIIGKEAELTESLFSSKERVDFVGPVDDAIEEIAKSKVAVAPLFTGSGTRLKILEAWAAGSAVVSTPLGAEGLDAQPGRHLEIAKDDLEFTRRILELLDDEERRSRMVDSARALLESRFTWPSAHKVLSELNL